MAKNRPPPILCLEAAPRVARECRSRPGGLPNSVPRRQRRWGLLPELTKRRSWSGGKTGPTRALLLRSFVRSKAAASRKRKSRPPPLSLNSPLLSTLATTVSQEIKHVKQLTHPFFSSSAASTSCARGLQSHPVPPPQKQRIKPLCTPSAHPSRFHLAPNVTRTDTRMLRSRAPRHPSCFRCQREPTGEVIRLSGSEGRGASFQQAASCGNPVPRRRSLPRCLLLPRCAHLGMSILRGGAAGVPVPGLRVTRGSKEPRGRFGQVPPLWLRSIGLLRKGSTLLS